VKPIPTIKNTKRATTCSRRILDFTIASKNRIRAAPMRD
jgi:hypothetical protein